MAIRRVSWLSSDMIVLQIKTLMPQSEVIGIVIWENPVPEGSCVCWQAIFRNEKVKGLKKLTTSLVVADFAIRQSLPAWAYVMAICPAQSRRLKFSSHTNLHVV